MDISYTTHQRTVYVNVDLIHLHMMECKLQLFYRNCLSGKKKTTKNGFVDICYIVAYDDAMIL